jgi:uncharacterized protein (TIGR02271 family)
MSKAERRQAYRVSEAPGDELGASALADTRTIELREEQLVAHKDLRDVGEIEIRTEIEDIPARLEVDAYREEVVVEHESVGQVVSERDEPWEEDGTLIIPIYEEQLVVTKRLVLRERMRVRRVGTTERQLFQDTLRRERLIVEDPQHTGLVREQYPVKTTDEDGSEEQREADEQEPSGSGFLGNLVRKALE